MSSLTVKFARRELHRNVAAGEYDRGTRLAIELLLVDGERQEACLDLWQGIGEQCEHLLADVLAAQGDTVRPELVHLQHRLAERLRPSFPENISV